MKEIDILESLIETENELQLDSYEIMSVPIWNVLKHKLRQIFLTNEGAYEAAVSKKVPFSFKKALISFPKSIIKFHLLLIQRPKIDNLVMGFPKMDLVNGLYIDRFIDPVIELSDLKNNYIYFEYGKTGFHYSNRPNKDKLLYTDYINWLGIIGGFILLPIIYLKERAKINSFVSLVSQCLRFKVKPKYVAYKIAEFKVLTAIYIKLLKIMEVKNVFGVSRILFKPVSFAAKKNNIKVYEFQHGITQTTTELYGGNYLPAIDPDYFLLFGDACPHDVFGIPTNKVINIGWAFKIYLGETTNKSYLMNSCLVISEPTITDKIIEATIELSKKYPAFEFHIRRHPQEAFSEEQIALINQYEKIKDVTNEINSFIVLLDYNFVIGENSTVLYEALSLGKKVARINFCGLNPVSRSEEDSFYYLDTVDDYKNYIEGERKIKSCAIYSDFKTNIFNSLIHGTYTI
ncbi:MAG: hypothetical protein IJE43_13920 [Alphaproteobacteria bacterium]|nr:hypothetical protein [Alphaproteobacteria bacterium]